MELAPLLSIDGPSGSSSPINKIQLELLGRLSEAGTDRKIVSLAFSPTDRRLLASASALDSFKGNGSVGLWDLTTAQVARSLQNPGDDRPWDQYKTVAYSRDGSMLAVLTEGMSVGGPVESKRAVVQLWDVNTGALKRTFGAGALFLPEALAFSPDGRMIAAGGGTNESVCIYSTSTGELIKSLTHPGVIASIAFSRDGKTLAVGDRDWHPSVRLWDVGTWTRARDLNPPQPSYGEAVAFSPDGKTLATGHYRGGVCLWDYRTGVRLRTLRYTDTEGGHALAFSPDGRFLTFVSGHRLQFWDPANGKLLGDFDIDAESLSLHRNGLLLATVDAPTGGGPQQQGASSIRIWRLRYASAN
jgi:WD40 repeat protein